ncbi:hypothetical protein [Roseateles sp.]|uniref:hypothetical protein n=1 Tax=Roseateles sp. TaxID=1971397 RepID=UPI002DFA0295|nr:hypothetical protein [Roseateles sp.]
MRFTVKTFAQVAVQVQAVPGRVLINGLSLLPHEAAAVGDALNQCADDAEEQGAQAVAQLTPEGA